MRGHTDDFQPARAVAAGSALGLITAGTHNVVWDGTDFRGAKVASGIYMYQLRGKDFVATRKLVLTK